ncbi:hypothetical protein NPIL_255081 [Nephila pilipes]|uniref:Uncharacterized protein n=1 Tax=Nephila pilipes TaxID=299642 RepID=A0A8X6I4E7_NEPPI|nr:hypothetical protein NPIL_255081 [Nephila pilipes]
MNLEIDKWLKDHCDIFLRKSISNIYLRHSNGDIYLRHPIDFQAYLCWNPLGKIDRETTAKSSINCKALSVTERYVLASRCWFIRDVWAAVALWSRS